MAIEVVPLSKSDIPGAIDIIQTAFADDPYFKWVFDSDSFNKQRNYDSLAARCLWGINNALFYVAKEKSVTVVDVGDSQNGDGDASSHTPQQQERSQEERILGVSCWLPPQPPTERSTWTSWFQDWVLTFRQVFNNIRYLGRGGLNTSRYYIWKERQGEAQKQIWTDPRGYYFCNMVAVSPEAQGMGIGGKLFKVVTERADREGFKCYLESSKSVPNVEIYRRMGFEMRMEMECRDGEDTCMLYCMVREPKSCSGSSSKA